MSTVGPGRRARATHSGGGFVAGTLAWPRIDQRTEIAPAREIPDPETPSACQLLGRFAFYGGQVHRHRGRDQINHRRERDALAATVARATAGETTTTTARSLVAGIEGRYPALQPLPRPGSRPRPGTTGTDRRSPSRGGFHWVCQCVLEINLGRLRRPTRLRPASGRSQRLHRCPVAPTTSVFNASHDWDIGAVLLRPA